VSEQTRNLVYESGQWQVHLGRRELLASGAAVPIGARAFEIIEVLVQSANELVTKNDLMDRIWPGAEVGENTLQVHISAIRKALGQDRTILKTAAGRGYRLIGDWRPRQQGPAGQPVVSSPLSASGAPPGIPLANNFPPITGRLIGRDAAASHVRDLVSAYRVATLTGPGGIGKTTLAIEAARGVVADFEDGGWFVELASLSNPDLVPSAVASALGLKLSGEISAEPIARAIDAKHLLLVLDNCEHVIDAAANLAERLVRLCPQVGILITSREVPRIDGEAVFRVPPLDVPAVGQDAPDHILGHAAVELFISRMHTLGVGFSPRAEELASIAAICRHLDGIPLAIEFAAASAATLGIAQVAMGLRDRFALLTSGRRIYYISNDHASARAMLARALWMQGFTERALREAHASLEELRGADYQLLLCRTLYYGICRIAPMIGDFATAEREITRLIDVATRLNAHFWETAGQFLKGKLLIERGEFAQGLPVLRDAFETCDRTGWRLSYPDNANEPNEVAVVSAENITARRCRGQHFTPPGSPRSSSPARAPIAAPRRGFAPSSPAAPPRVSPTPSPRPAPGVPRSPGSTGQFRHRR